MRIIVCNLRVLSCPGANAVQVFLGLSRITNYIDDISNQWFSIEFQRRKTEKTGNNIILKLNEDQRLGAKRVNRKI
jgi:hypothetical protein